jgi:folate-dependent phosphoribosylglycinamide formyltransferase PurN
MAGSYMKGKVRTPYFFTVRNDQLDLVVLAGYCALIGRTLVGGSESRLWNYLSGHDSSIVCN